MSLTPIFRRGFFSIFLLVGLINLTSCKVTLVPDYDANLASDIEETAKKVDTFLLTMLETTRQENGERSYENFVEKYIEIEVELNSLVTRNKIKPLNEESSRIAEIVFELWVRFKERHKACENPDTCSIMSDGRLKLQRIKMSDAFYAMLSAEEGKKYANPEGDS